MTRSVLEGIPLPRVGTRKRRAWERENNFFIKMEKYNRVPPVSPHPDIITPEEVAYWHSDEGRKQLRENRKKLLAWDEQEYQEYQERKKIAEDAEKRGETKGELKTLMSLFLEKVIGIDVVKRKLNAKTDTELEKKFQEVFPDFHLPAHI